MIQKPLTSQVVVQLPGGAIKGHLIDDSLSVINPSALDPLTISVRVLGSSEVRDIPLEDAKGVFFVKEFEGKTDHSDLRFHDSSAPANYLWVRLTFQDGELLEGMIENSLSFVVSKGLWITPTDPTGNNWLIYALKAHLKDFEVLGMRQNMHRHMP